MINKILKLCKSKLFFKGLLSGIAATVEHEILLKDIQPPNTIIDIGSNKGQFLILIEKMFPGRTAYSFEPIKEMMDKQKKFFSFKQNIYFYNYALGSESSLKNFFITLRKDSSSFLKINEVNNQNKNYNIKENRPIQINTLDDCFENKNIKQPILIKIDVQGYELEVLKGSAKTLNSIDYIYVEVNSGEVYEGCAKIEEIDDFLDKHNFLRVATKFAYDFLPWGDAFYVRRENLNNTQILRAKIYKYIISKKYLYKYFIYLRKFYWKLISN